MELSERCIQTLEKEGFTGIHEEHRISGFIFDVVNDIGRVTLFVTDGSLLLCGTSTIKELLPGDRFDVPPHVPQPVIAGPSGCQFVIGEK